MGDDRPQWLDDMGSELCSEPDVVFAVVFGSRVDGRPRGSSDVDIAVKFADGLSSRDRFHRLCSLSGSLQGTDLPFVDVSDIQALPLPVARRALCGALLCGDEASFRRHKEIVEAEFDDRREDLQRRDRALIERIANGGLRGG